MDHRRPATDRFMPRVFSLLPGQRPLQLRAAVLGGVFLLLACAVRQPVLAQAHSAYELGYRQVAKLESELFTALEPKRRKLVSFETVLLEHIRLPCLAGAPGTDNEPGGPLQVSLGFVDFLNRLAHAKAHEEIEPGFFRRYTARLEEETRLSPVPDFDPSLPPNAWNLEGLNRQASYFNQMAGGLVAVDLAHQYLGHYRKHAKALARSAALPPPLNTQISETEWRAAVLSGAQNALACGLATDGLRAVFECFEPMSPRPAWAAYFIHPQADVGRIGVELLKQERDFFAMDHKPRRPAGGMGGKDR